MERNTLSLPHESAEEYVLGSILSAQDDEVYELLDQISVDLFLDDDNRRLAEVMLKLNKNGIRPDIITVSSAIAEQHDKQLEAYVFEVGHDLIFMPSSFRRSVQYLYNRDYVLKVREAATNILKMAAEPMVDIEYLQSKSEEALIRAAAETKAIEAKYTSATEGLDEVGEDMIDAWENQGGLRGITSGFTPIDAKVRGFKPGEFTILAGRPSTGKTAMAMNMVVRSIVQSDTPALFFSLEMTKAALQERLIMFGLGMYGAESHRRQVDDGGYAPPGVIRDGITTLERVLQDRLFIDATSMLNEAQLRTRIGRAIKEHNIGLVCVDYLQIMNYSDRTESRQVEVMKLSQALKAAAKDFEIPILCLSQLSRSSGDYGEPNLSDLRDSGAIEQDADVVLMLWRPRNDFEHTYMKIAKSRNGQLGKIEFTFDPACYNFVAQRDVTGCDLTPSSGSGQY